MSLDLDTFSEFGENGINGKVKDFSIKDGFILKNSRNMHFIFEWIDLKLIKKSSLSTINLFSSENDLLVSNNFDLTLHNLGLDLKGLEE